MNDGRKKLESCLEAVKNLGHGKFVAKTNPMRADHNTKCNVEAHECHVGSSSRGLKSFSIETWVGKEHCGGITVTISPVCVERDSVSASKPTREGACLVERSVAHWLLH